jgi:bifunctional DNA-binding transcriptional regulator/antitoxin component of YhaV-PrlF toxin-antitoxin module
MRTVLTVDDDGILTFPENFLDSLGWKEGDVLEWIDNKDGSFSLRKPDESERVCLDGEVSSPDN